MLDAVLCPEWEYRYYSFDRNWSDNEQLGSMRNGEGDHFFALFNDSGCFLKGFDHESSMSPWKSADNRIWPGMLDNVPDCFSDCLVEPAFDMQNITFCVWQEYADSRWRKGEIDFPEGEDPDGSHGLLSVLDGRPESYAKWAQSYYEVDVDEGAVSEMLSGRPLTQSLIERISPKQSLELLADDLNSIGWSTPG